MKIQDNFLPQEQHEHIRKNMMSAEFPWFYNSSVLYGVDHDDDISDRGQFTHAFLVSDKETSRKKLSHQFDLIKSLLDNLKGSEIFRIKSNLQLRTESIEKTGWHDDGFGDCTTAIYYINSNDGVTEFEDGSLVHSVANRLVTFNGTMKHRGSTHTNTKTRVLINLNYQ